MARRLRGIARAFALLMSAGDGLAEAQDRMGGITEMIARLIDRLIHYYRTEHHRKPSCFCEGKEG